MAQSTHPRSSGDHTFRYEIATITIHLPQQ
jgi:hypothetical protein